MLRLAQAAAALALAHLMLAGKSKTAMVAGLALIYLAIRLITDGVITKTKEDKHASEGKEQ